MNVNNQLQRVVVMCFIALALSVMTTIAVQAQSSRFTFIDYWEATSDSTGSTKTERRLNCPDGAILTGVGATVYKSNVTYLKIQCRPIRLDGTLGWRQEYSAGSTRKYAPEAWAEIPDTYAIVGVGANVYRNNVNTLNVFVRQYDSDRRRLVGPEHEMSFGTHPIPGNNEAEVRTNTPYGPELGKGESYGVDRLFVTGVGMNAFESNMNRMIIRVGALP